MTAGYLNSISSLRRLTSTTSSAATAAARAAAAANRAHPHGPMPRARVPRLPPPGGRPVRQDLRLQALRQPGLHTLGGENCAECSINPRTAANNCKGVADPDCPKMLRCAGCGTERGRATAGKQIPHNQCNTTKAQHLESYAIGCDSMTDFIHAPLHNVMFCATICQQICYNFQVLE